MEPENTPVGSEETPYKPPIFGVPAPGGMSVCTMPFVSVVVVPEPYPIAWVVTEHWMSAWDEEIREESSIH